MPKAVTPKKFGAPPGMYSHGMVASGGEIVVVAGQVGIGQGGEVAGGDVVAQTKQALENVRAVVEATGCSMRDIVRLQTFLTHAADIPGFMKARAEVFPGYFPDGVHPPNTLLIISSLVKPELLVEIEAMAVRPAKVAAAKAPKSPRQAAKPAKRPRARKRRR